VTLLRRPPGARRARVAGRVVIKAPDLDEARRAAQAALEERDDGESRWTLGVLRPLTPRAPGTHRYLVTFSQWEPHEEHFERRDVHVIELWAADGQSARRLAQQEIQKLPAYQPTWRIRSVARTAAARDAES
jgi:hypothetical protein